MPKAKKPKNPVIKVNFYLPEDAKIEARKIANLHYYGAETIPLKIPGSSLPKELHDAHSTLSRSFQFEIEVECLPDGRQKMLKINDYDVSKGEIVLR